MQDDLALLEAWRKGDAAAGRTLFKRHFPSLRRFFVNKIDEGVEDLIQSTLLACLESKSVRTNFRAFLFAVARNELFDHFRKRWRIEPEVTTVDSLIPSPSRVVAGKREERLLLEGLRRLPLDSQILLELYYWDELSTDELAEVLGVQATTITTRLWRVRKQLGEVMESLAGGSEPLHTTMDNLDQWARRVRGAVENED